MRLMERGHRVVVYNRVPFNMYREPSFRGVEVVRMPTIQAKGTDTLVHSALSTAHVLVRGGIDIVYYCGVGSAIFSLPSRLRGARTVVNVDGADWERAKWGRMGKTWLRWSERLAARFADAVIADHPIIAERYKKQFGIDCELISYGAEVVTSDPGTDALEHFSLQPDSYFIYISRLTPENGADLVMEAFIQSNAQLPLVVVGDAPYLPSFQQHLRNLASQADGRIIMTGYQFGDVYKQLSFHARAFIFPTTIEATRPVLLEQMGMGSCVVARDTPANRHILGDAALWFDSNSPVSSLAEKLHAISQENSNSDAIGKMAQSRISEYYNWDRITDLYEDLFQRLRA